MLRLMSFVLTAMVACVSVAAPAEPIVLPAAVQAGAYLHDIWRKSGTPGLSVAITVKGELVFSEGVGVADIENLVPATGSTVYNIGSTSKVITAIAVMQLVEQGKVKLDDPIQNYVPEFPVKPEGTITVRNIMMHTSGIRHYRSGDFPGTEDGENEKPYASWIEGLNLFKDDPLLFAPGKYYSYSSYAVNLLQGVVERASGLPFETYLRRFVWAPAGMSSTTFDIPSRIIPRRARSYSVSNTGTTNYYYNDLTYKFASGGMMSSVEDLVRFGSALNRGGLLRPETIALMYRRHLDPVLRFNPDGPPEAQEFAQGLMWRIFKDSSGRTFVNHCGTVKGFNACVVNYPAEDIVVAIAGNGDPVTPARNPAVAFAQFFLPDAKP